MKGKVSGGGRLRIKCLIIGYLNLGVTAVDIVFHVLIAAIVSNGFMCDVDKASLRLVDWPWLEPLLLILNTGTHGFYFYAFPMTLRTNGHYAEHMPIPQYPRCYPGHFHVYLIDILTFFINMIWLNFVMTYLRAIYKKDPETMKMFFDVSIVKLILQILYFAYEPIIQNTFSAETFWFMKLSDICITAGILVIMKSYINVLRKEISEDNADWSNSYIEYMIGTSKGSDTKDKTEPADDVTVVCEKTDKPAEIKHKVNELRTPSHVPEGEVGITKSNDTTTV